MYIETSRFGRIEVGEDARVRIPSGLPGFAEIKEYAIVPHPGGGPFSWLQSLNDPSLAFVIADPRRFCPDYRAVIPRSEVEGLHLDDERDGQVWVICGMRAEPEDITANFAAPIIVNRANRLGKQILIPDSPYGTRFPIIRHGRETVREAR